MASLGRSGYIPPPHLIAYCNDIKQIGHFQHVVFLHSYAGAYNLLSEFRNPLLTSSLG